MTNPTKYEKFNRLFHITCNMFTLIKKLDKGKTCEGYLKQASDEIDQLFLGNLQEEKEKENG